jgi:hypothetical protein
VVSTLILPFAGGEICINPDERGWCKVHLLYSGEEVFLGALLLSDLVAKLRSVLLVSVTSPKWILSLSETHVSFYARVSNAEVLLTIQNSGAQTIYELHIGPNERLEWANKLAC